MGRRSKEWKTHRFDEMAVMVRDKIDNPAEADVDRYVGLEHLDSDSLKIRRWGAPTDVEATKLCFKAGDIIFGRRRVYQRKLAVADFDGICSAHAMVLRAKAETVLPEFLPFFMQSDLFMDRALEISVGSLSPTINWKTLAQQEFALPPLDEQRRIAEVLHAFRNASECTQTLLAKARTVHSTLRLHVFGLRNGLANGVARNWSTRPGWKTTSIGEAAQFLDGRRVPLKDADRAARPGPYPYYGASGVIDTIDDYIFDEELLLVSEDGANLLDRSTPIAFLAEGKYWVNNHAHVLRAAPPYSNFILAEYIEGLNLRPYITGTAQPKLNKAACASIPVPRPPKEELPGMEAKLRLSVASIAQCEKRAAQSTSLLKAALARMASPEKGAVL